MSSILCKSKPKTDTVGSASPATDWWYLLPDAKSDPRLLLFSWIASVHCKTGNSVLEATCSVVLLLQTYQHCTHRWASCADALICGGCDGTSFNLGAWHSLWRFRPGWACLLTMHPQSMSLYDCNQPSGTETSQQATSVRTSVTKRMKLLLDIAWYMFKCTSVAIPSEVASGKQHQISQFSRSRADRLYQKWPPCLQPSVMSLFAHSRY